MAKKNVVQIAFDERQYSLLPLLMHESELQGSTVKALFQGFKLTVGSRSSQRR